MIHVKLWQEALPLQFERTPDLRDQELPLRNRGSHHP
jgi:hypothetical protein